MRFPDNRMRRGQCRTRPTLSRGSWKRIALTLIKLQFRDQGVPIGHTTRRPDTNATRNNTTAMTNKT
jgi:hypothetical protein